MDTDLMPAAIDPLALIERWPDRYPGWLESSADHPATGRHDLLAIASGEHLRLDRDGLVRNQDDTVVGTDFAATLDANWQAAAAMAAPADDSVFAGGWLLYLGYETVAQFEPGLRLPGFDQAELPVALAIRTPAAWSHDRLTGAVNLHAEAGHEDLLQRFHDDIATAMSAPATTIEPSTPVLVEDPPQRFLDGVGRILDYLRAGDVFQVNLSRGWLARFEHEIDPVALYRRLRELNPAPFSGLLRWRGCALVSSSPERLLRVRGRRIDTRPIAGTRPRGSDAESDLALRTELLAHPKERAEHVMLIDLERNDLGRICVPGSIRVDELMALESHRHVHHIVSNVGGELRAEITPGAVLRALFPGGTITGCPKVRCMEIIAELEGAGRGPYTGAIGYLASNGDMDLNILIRSAWTQGRDMGFRTGAGIVADSVPERELAETRTKARGMLALLGYDA